MDNSPLGLTRLSMSLILAAVCASVVSGAGLALVSLGMGQLLLGFWNDALLFSFLSLVPAGLIALAATFPAYFLVRPGLQPSAFAVVATGAAIGALPYGMMMLIGAATGAYVAWASLVAGMGVHIIAGAVGAGAFFCAYRGIARNVGQGS